jgi:hypothetical protein
MIWTPNGMSGCLLLLANDRVDCEGIQCNNSFRCLLIEKRHRRGLFVAHHRADPMLDPFASKKQIRTGKERQFEFSGTKKPEYNGSSLPAKVGDVIPENRH